jgi:hypothetical protein
MVGWSNDFRLIESGNSDIDFIRVGSAQESQRAAARPAERADAPCPRNLKRLAFGKLKIVPPKRSPGYKRATGALATIFAMTMSGVVGSADAFVSNCTAQAAAANPL